MRISDWSSDVCSSDLLLARAEALGTERGEVSLWAAQALARLGDIEQARQRLGTARKEGIDPGRIRSSPILRGLAEASLSARGGEERRQYCGTNRTPGDGPTVGRHYADSTAARPRPRLVPAAPP